MPPSLLPLPAVPPPPPPSATGEPGMPLGPTVVSPGGDDDDPLPQPARTQTIARPVSLCMLFGHASAVLLCPTEMSPRSHGTGAFERHQLRRCPASVVLEPGV